MGNQLVLIRHMHYNFMYHFNLEEGDFFSLPLGAVKNYKDKGLRCEVCISQVPTTHSQESGGEPVYPPPHCGGTICQ